MEEKILSAGIDLGTTTTQLIFSRLTIQNLATSYTVPRISIVDKAVIYRSEIYFTPLRSEREIDAEAVKKIVLAEYQKAGLRPDEIRTGAVIITGDTARKENANQVLATLSGLAGDFVVATAGPALESILSAKGAGTDVCSKRTRSAVANIDVGGGTSNFALFENGVQRDVACLNVGGRMIRVQDGRIRSVFPDIARLAEKHGLRLAPGDPADVRLLEPVCRHMADALFAVLGVCPAGEPAAKALSTNGAPLFSSGLRPAGVTFSGGVADFIYSPAEADFFRFGDIGPLLGKVIREHPAMASLQLHAVQETIRATVVGAGSHTTEVSGSTITCAADRLPMKNVPILHVSKADESDPAGLAAAIRRQLPVYRPEGRPDQLAVALDGGGYSDFASVQTLAEALLDGLAEQAGSGIPLLIVLRHDIGKALGFAMKSKQNIRQGPAVPILCIDGIQTINGDYIDIGQPIAEGRVVPVVIKTLVFNN